MNPTHQVTFFFGTTGQQKVLWDREKLDKKRSIKELARDWANDLGASSHIVEEVK